MILAEDIILSLLGDNRLRELDWGHSENVKERLHSRVIAVFFCEQTDPKVHLCFILN